MASSKEASQREDAEWKRKHRRVLQIEEAGRKRIDSPGSSPRKSKALAWSFMVSLGVAAVWFALRKFGLVQPTPSLSALALATFVASVSATYIAVRVFSKVPTSYHDLLFTRLAEYIPVDKDGFRRLQAHTRETGQLEQSELCLWVINELRAIAREAGWLTAKASFVQREV